MNAFQIDAAGYTLTHTGPDTWRVLSPSGASYTVRPEIGECSCPDARARGHKRACKHVRALRALLRLCPGLDG